MERASPKQPSNTNGDGDGEGDSHDEVNARGERDNNREGNGNGEANSNGGGNHAENGGANHGGNGGGNGNGDSEGYADHEGSGDNIGDNGNVIGTATELAEVKQRLGRIENNIQQLLDRSNNNITGGVFTFAPGNYNIQLNDATTAGVNQTRDTTDDRPRSDGGAIRRSNTVTPNVVPDLHAAGHELGNERNATGTSQKAHAQEEHQRSNDNDRNGGHRESGLKRDPQTDHDRDEVHSTLHRDPPTDHYSTWMEPTLQPDPLLNHPQRGQVLSKTKSSNPPRWQFESIDVPAKTLGLDLDPVYNQSAVLAPGTKRTRTPSVPFQPASAGQSRKGSATDETNGRAHSTTGSGIHKRSISESGRTGPGRKASGELFPGLSSYRGPDVPDTEAEEARAKKRSRGLLTVPEDGEAGEDEVESDSESEFETRYEIFNRTSSKELDVHDRRMQYAKCNRERKQAGLPAIKKGGRAEHALAELRRDEEE